MKVLLSSQNKKGKKKKKKKGFEHARPRTFSCG
jgi:hypothetical protein